MADVSTSSDSSELEEILGISREQERQRQVKLEEEQRRDTNRANVELGQILDRVNALGATARLSINSRMSSLGINGPISQTSMTSTSIGAITTNLINISRQAAMLKAQEDEKRINDLATAIANSRIRAAEEKAEAFRKETTQLMEDFRELSEQRIQAAKEAIYEISISGVSDTDDVIANVVIDVHRRAEKDTLKLYQDINDKLEKAFEVEPDTSLVDQLERERDLTLMLRKALSGERQTAEEHQREEARRTREREQERQRYLEMTQRQQQQELRRQQEERARMVQKAAKDHAARIAAEFAAAIKLQSKLIETALQEARARHEQVNLGVKISKQQIAAGNPALRTIEDARRSLGTNGTHLSDKLAKDRQQRDAAAQMAAAHGTPVPPGTPVTYRDPNLFDANGNKKIDPKFQIVDVRLNADSKAALDGDHLTSSAQVARVQAGATAGAPVVTGIETNAGLSGNGSSKTVVDAETYAYDMDDPARQAPHRLFGKKN